MTCLKATSDEFKMAAIQFCCAVEKKSHTSERGGTTLWYWSLLRQPAYTVTLEYTYTHTVATTADSGGCLKNEMISLAWNMNEWKFLRSFQIHHRALRIFPEFVKMERIGCLVEFICMLLHSSKRFFPFSIECRI